MVETERSALAGAAQMHEAVERLRSLLSVVAEVDRACEPEAARSRQPD